MFILMIELNIIILAFKCVYEGRVPIITYVKGEFADDIELCESLASMESRIDRHDTYSIKFLYTYRRKNKRFKVSNVWIFSKIPFCNII